MEVFSRRVEKSHEFDGWPRPPVSRWSSWSTWLIQMITLTTVFGLVQGCGVYETMESSRTVFDAGMRPENIQSGESDVTLLTSASSTALSPGSMVVKRGSTSNQPLSVLGIKEQSGSDDLWAAYVEFIPSGTGATAVFSFDVPATLPLAQLSGLSVEVNYKGQQASVQKWAFALYDHVKGAWVTIGTNSFAGDWVWSAASLAASGSLSRFISSGRKIQLRYMTSSSFDASALDYLVVKLQSAGSTPPSPSPSPSPSASPTPSAPPPSGTWWKPSPGLTWQMQYSGTIDTSLNVQVYMLDMFGTTATTISALKSRGVKVVCYIDGGSWESYTPDAGVFPESILGKVVGGWPDERFVDIRSKDLLWPIMRARIDLAKQKGCDGIYHDWADSFMQDTGFPLTATDQLTYNRFWIAEAHARGISIGLINDLLQVAELADEYDWGLNESCMNYNECGYLKPFIDAGKPVFALQYSGDPAVYCPKLNALNFDGLFKKVALDAYRLPCR